MKKRLLILGGTSISRQIVYAAHELGMDVYVTDYYADSPCKLIAEKSFEISCTDVDAVCQLIEDERIDGVMMGYADVLLPYYVKICQKAGLPCYANLRAIEITADKSNFKSLCRKFEVPVVPEYTKEEVDRDEVTYPIIVKPVDNSGARGIYTCHNKQEFDTYYQESLKFSPSKHVLIEHFMTGNEATIFYYLHKGEIYLLGVSDRHMLHYSDCYLQLPIGYTFPSLQQNSFIKNQDANIKKMFRSLDMKEGMVFIQSFNDDGKYIIYEMGYRLTGSIEQHLMEKVHRFNHLKAILNFAVGNPVDIAPLTSINIDDAVMANVTLLLSEGTIGRYMGENEVMNIPGVLHIHKSYPEGTVIGAQHMGRLAQVGLRVLLYADNRQQLLHRMDLIKNTLHVISTCGEEMILDKYTYEDVCVS